MATYTGHGSNDSTYTLELIVTEKSYSVDNNTSEVAWTLNLKTTTSTFGYWNLSRSVTINGTTVLNDSGNYNALSNNTTYKLGSGTLTVTHSSDGSKSISCSASASTPTSAGYLPGSMSCSGTLTLTTIPRASVPSVSPASVIPTGSNSITINTNRKSSSFTHTITYAFGSATGTITTKTTSESVTWKPARSLLAQIPNAQSGTGTITCDTYSGSTKIGTKTCTFTLETNAATSGATIGTPTFTEKNSSITSKAIAANETVRYLSKKQITLTVTAQDSATIKSVTVKNGTKSVSMTLSSGSYTATIDNVTTGTYTFTVTDSRGISVSTDVTHTLRAYTYPTILSCGFARPSATASTATLTPKGTFYNGTIGTTTNSITWKFKLSTATSYTTGTTPTKSGSNWNASRSLSGLNYKLAYSCEIVATDSCSQSVSLTVNLAASQYALWLGKNTARIKDYLIVDRVVKAATGIFTSEMRPTDANLEQDEDKVGGIEHYLATASMTENKPTKGNGHILHMRWDTTAGYDTQLLFSNNGNNPYVQMRGMYTGEWKDWNSIPVGFSGIKVKEYNKGQTSIATSLGTNVSVTLPSDLKTSLGFRLKQAWPVSNWTNGAIVTIAEDPSFGATAGATINVRLTTTSAQKYTLVLELVYLAV